MKQIILLIYSLFIFTGCGCKTNFMGADKYATGTLGTERWYLKPQYKKEDIPTGTAFYGASAKKIEDKFDIKYYITDKKGECTGETVEVPKNNIWTIKHNGKRFNEQDDDNLFIYAKDSDNKYYKHITHHGQFNTLSHSGEYFIKTCYKDGWCKLYPNYWGVDLYIKQSILDKPLSE